MREIERERERERDEESMVKQVYYCSGLPARETR